MTIAPSPTSHAKAEAEFGDTRPGYDDVVRSIQLASSGPRDQYPCDGCRLIIVYFTQPAFLIEMPSPCEMAEGRKASDRSVTRLMLVDGESRVLLVIGRVYVASAVVFSVFALGLRTRLDISEHENSCKHRECGPKTR